MVVHSKLRRSEVREAALDSEEGSVLGGSTDNYTSASAATSVHNGTRVCDRRANTLTSTMTICGDRMAEAGNGVQATTYIRMREWYDQLNA